jgi:cytochrome oxidase Cu insertion factor (SCO1/SenC/PrrC family)
MVGLALAAAVLALGVGLGVHRLTTGNAAKSTAQVVMERHGMFGAASWAPGTRPAPQINGLSDQRGRPFSLTALHGRTVAIVFFDSHCHQECPLEGHALAAAERPLPRAERPVLVAVSVNPLDTRASVAAAVRAWGLAGLAPWYWLMGSHRMLAPAWRAYHIQVTPPIGGDIQHTEALYLIDRSGDIRSAYLWPFADHFVTSDLRTLAKRPVKA